LSGYGGQPGWQDPYDPRGYQQPPGYYGPTPGGWQDPYGAAGYGYGPPGVPVAQASSGAAIGALVCNIIMTLTCLGLPAIAGIITAAIAMGRVQTNPQSARNLTTWSWVIFAINVVLVMAIVIILVVAAHTNPAPSSPTTTT
jgi:hypothetical protein